MKRRLLTGFGLIVVATCLIAHSVVLACTGITLKAKDGTVVVGRTMEWGSFDLRSQLVIVPRGYQFTAQTPDGKTGITWKAKYGVVGMDVVNKDVIVDGMNEVGLTVGLFFHPGFAEYPKYDPARAAESLSSTEVAQYLLTLCSSVEEARAAIARIHVVAVIEPALGMAPPVHYLVTEPSGKAIVIEFLKGELKIFDTPLGVITNSPNYDWHETNLRNYVNLSPVAIPDRKIGDLDFKPLGVGSGMIGLPGDFTPPSRFVRAVAFTQTARVTHDGEDAICELFRILDNFNVPLGVVEAAGGGKARGMLSSTLWTSGYDLKNKVLYYHTQHNRRIRRLDLKKIDFTTGAELTRMPMDKVKAQDFEDVLPTGK